MTYTLNNGTSMVLADVGDTFEVDPMLIFTRDGKEVPVAAVIPSIQSIDIHEDPIVDGFNLELTDAAGQVSNHFFPTLDGIATHLQRMATAAPQEPAEAAPAAEAVDDPSPATDAAQSPQGGAMALLQEDVDRLLDEDSPLRIGFHIAQRIFSDSSSQVTLEDVDRVAKCLTDSDRLAADAEATGKVVRSGKTKSAALAAAAEARAAANIMARFLFTDEDLELADFYNSNFTAWCSLGPWLRLYQQMLLLRRSVEGGNLGTLTMTRNQDTGKPILQHPDGKVFTVGDIPDYTVYVFDSCDTTISVALSSGYRIRLDDRYATDDELRDRLLFGVSAAVGDYNYGLMYYLNDFEDDWAPSTCDDVITVAANASPSDLLALFLVYSFGHWRNDPHSEYEIEDVVRDMAERLRGAPAAPVWAAQEAAEAAPGQEVTDDTTPATEPATEPSEPPLSAEEAAVAAGIFLEPTDGATEILICCGEFLESTKMPIMTITWRARATDFNLAHIVFRAWTVIDESDSCGYMRACDRVKKYYGKYCPQDDFNRMTLDILQKRYPNGEADIKDEFDERAVASMRRLETRYPKPPVNAA